MVVSKTFKALKVQSFDRYVKQNNYAVDVKVDILVENVEYMIIYHHSNQSNKFLQHLHNDIDEIIKIRPQMNFIICSTSKINQCSKVIQENFKSIEIKQLAPVFKLCLLNLDEAYKTTIDAQHLRADTNLSPFFSVKKLVKY